MTRKKGEVKVMVLQDHTYTMSHIQIGDTVTPVLLSSDKYPLSLRSVINGFIFDLSVFEKVRQKPSTNTPLIICVFSSTINEKLSKTKHHQIDTKKIPYKEHSQSLNHCCAKSPLFYHALYPYSLIIQYLLLSSFLHTQLIAITSPLHALLSLHHHSHQHASSEFALTEQSTLQDLAQKKIISGFGKNNSHIDNEQLLYTLGTAYIARELI